MQPFYAYVYPVEGGVGGPVDPGFGRPGIGSPGGPGGPGGGLGTWGPGSPIHGQLPSPGGPGPGSGQPPGINYPQFPSHLPSPGGPGHQPPHDPNWTQAYVPGQGWTWVYVGPVPGYGLPGGPPPRPDNTLPGSQPGIDHTLPGQPPAPARPGQPLPPTAQPKK
jgi:hypothetical protein